MDKIIADKLPPGKIFYGQHPLEKYFGEKPSRLSSDQGSGMWHSGPCCPKRQNAEKGNLQELQLR